MKLLTIALVISSINFLHSEEKKTVEPTKEEGKTVEIVAEEVVVEAEAETEVEKNKVIQKKSTFGRRISGAGLDSQKGLGTPRLQSFDASNNGE